MKKFEGFTEILTDRKKELKAMPLEGRVRELGGEWITQMLEYFEGNLKLKPRMTCPSCLSNVTEFGDRGWRCLYRDCAGFSDVLKASMPPNPIELEDYWKRRKLEEKINMFLKSK